MMLLKTFHSFVAVTLLVASVAQADEPPPLQHNPFARPISLITNSDPASPAAIRISDEIELRATMVGAQNSLADVGGRIIRPGQSVNGLQLVRVFDDRAEFEINGNRLTVYVRPPTDSDDE